MYFLSKNSILPSMTENSKFFHVAKLSGEILQKKKKEKAQQAKLGDDTRECKLSLRTYVLLSQPFRSQIYE